MNKIVILSHFNYSDAGPIHGPLHTITSYLQRTGKDYLALAYPLYAGTHSIKEVYKNDQIKELKFGSAAKMSLPVKSLYEIFLTLKMIGPLRPNLIIAIDPLNAVAAILLKKIGLASKIIYYTVDYTPNRFPSKILNTIYHKLDIFSIQNSDAVWNVSSRILEERTKQGLPKDKNYLIPNSPSFNIIERLPLSKVDRFKIMMVTGLTHTPIFEMLIGSISDIVKKYPKVKLCLIGGGPHEAQLRDEVKKANLQKNIEFSGQLDHDSLLKKLLTGGVGLAIYTGDYDWIKYGDSMKAREYLLCGLPVIISDLVSTADDIKKAKAGEVIEPTQEQIYKALEKLLKDEKYWKKSRENAIELAKEYDIDKILKNALAKFGI